MPPATVPAPPRSRPRTLGGTLYAITCGIPIRAIVWLTTPIRRRLRDAGDELVLYLLLVIALFASLLSALTNGGFNPDWWVSWLQNFSTEMVGAFLTFWLLQIVVGNRNEKRRLIAQLGSPDNAVTREAIRILWMQGWLQDGSVRGANLWGANFIHADLGQCDLRQTNLYWACLRESHLWGADLRGAYLLSANLEGARLSHPRFGTAQFDQFTTLPDNTTYDPTQGPEQLDRFIHRDHPDFWRPHANEYGYYPWWHRPTDGAGGGDIMQIKD
jgi:hypothetical protein